MAHYYNDFPAQNYQVSDWDLEPENFIPFTRQYRQTYLCQTCHGVLPYKGVPHEDCPAGEADEGFFEDDRYLPEFYSFCEESANHPAYDIFYRCASHNHVHIITPEVNEPAEEEVEAEEVEARVEPNEPDILIIDENVEVIVIGPDDEVMEIE